MLRYSGAVRYLVAALIYVGLTRAQPEPFAYIVAHALKLVGGACGGFVAQRRLRRNPLTIDSSAGYVFVLHSFIELQSKLFLEDMD